MKEIKITKNEENQRLDKYLLKYFNKAPKSFVYKMLRKKHIKLNKGKAEGSEMLLEGDTLQLYLAEETMAGFMEEKTVPLAERHFGIVYEDDDILVVNKPAGLLTHPEKRRIGIPSQTRFCITSTKKDNTRLLRKAHSHRQSATVWTETPAVLWWQGKPSVPCRQSMKPFAAGVWINIMLHW